MKRHPIKSDARWTVTREHTGKPAPQFVIRFCGDWIDSRSTYPAAVLCAEIAKAERDDTPPHPMNKPRKGQKVERRSHDDPDKWQPLGTIHEIDGNLAHVTRPDGTTDVFIHTFSDGPNTMHRWHD